MLGKKSPTLILMQSLVAVSYTHLAVDAVLPAAYTKAIDELKVSPLAMPDIDVKEISKENGVSFEAVVTVKPNVELGLSLIHI